jgi:hypothetical protein
MICVFAMMSGGKCAPFWFLDKAYESTPYAQFYSSRVVSFLGDSYETFVC